MASIPKPIRDWISQFFTEEDVPQSSSDVDHDQTIGGTDGNPHADSASTNHDNTAHSVAYTDYDADDAVDTIESTELDILDADISGDAATVDGYEIQVDGSDGDGIINFKTE